jgi:hypothetical protein
VRRMSVTSVGVGVRRFELTDWRTGACTLLLAVACSLVVLVPAALADTVGTPILVEGSLYGVACPSASSCEAVGSNETLTAGVVVPITNGTPGNPITVPGIGLNAVTCQSASSCEAVGSNGADFGDGVVVAITNGIPGTPIIVPGVQLTGVACQSASSCEAVGQSTHEIDGVVVAITNGIPGNPITVPGASDLYAVACQSASSCEAGGENTAGTAGVVVPITNGILGAPIAVPGGDYLDGVACPSASSCEAIGSYGNYVAVVVPITNGTPGTPIDVPNDDGDELDALACQSASSCQAVGNGVVPITGGTPGTPIVAPGSPILRGVGCQSATRCEAVGTVTNSYVGVVVSISTSTPAASATHPTTHGASVTDKVTCHGLAGQSCKVTEQISTVERHKTKRRTVIVGSKTKTIKAGHTATVTIVLNGTGKRLLAHFGKLPVTLTISLTQNGKRHTITHRKLTLEPAKPKH